MPKYKSRPNIIEAQQWFLGKYIKGVCYNNELKRYYVITIHNQITYIEEGDYIITEPDGIHYYPCKPDIFERRYELIT